MVGVTAKARLELRAFYLFVAFSNTRLEQVSSFEYRTPLLLVPPVIS